MTIKPMESVRRTAVAVATGAALLAGTAVTAPAAQPPAVAITCPCREPQCTPGCVVN